MDLDLEDLELYLAGYGVEPLPFRATRNTTERLRRNDLRRLVGAPMMDL
jgi:hypothetical protein